MAFETRKKITDLTSGTALGGTEEFPFWQAGKTVKATLATLATYMAGLINTTATTDLATAATVTLAGTATPNVRFTGTTGVSSFGNVAVVNVRRWCYAAAAFTITHSATLVCPGSVNLVLAAGDKFIAVSRAANSWEIEYVERASGQPAVSSATPFPRGAIDGFQMANNGTDAVNDIDVAAGSARDDADGSNLTTTATIVKQIDIAFAEYSTPSTASGGRASADNLTGAKWFHVFMIGGSGKNTQPFFATSLSPTLPTGFTTKRRIGSVYWTGTTIKAFVQIGDEFVWAVPSLDASSTTQSTTAVSYTLLTPSGVRCLAKGSAWHDGAGPCNVLVTPLDIPDQAVSGSGANPTASPFGNIPRSVPTYVECWTNTSSQIRARAQAAATVGFYWQTTGYTDLRGKL